MSLVISTDQDVSRLSHLQEKVFGNELIMQKILSKLLWQDITSMFQLNHELSSAKARSFRLVSKIWMYQTNDLFEQHIMPLFSFHTCMCMKSGYFEGKNSKFIKYMDDVKQGSLESPPPFFKLTIEGSTTDITEKLSFLDICFNSQNTTVLSSMVRLEIYNSFEINPLNMAEIPSDIKLPFLREFIVYDNWGQAHGKLVLFINSILNASPVLRKLEIRELGPASVVPNVGINFNLPQTLRHLIIHFKHIWAKVNVSTPLVLPHLQKLELCEEEEAFDRNQDFAEDVREKMDRSMPNLDNLVVHLQSCEELEKWCRPQWKRWPGLRTLGLYGTEPIPEEDMARIHGAFESVVNLEFVFEWNINPDVSPGWLRTGMKYILEEMRHLKSLKVCVYDMDYTEEYEWDMILLGIESPEKVRQLRDSIRWKSFCEKYGNKPVQEEEEQKEMIRIRNLKNLESFHLRGERIDDLRENEFNYFHMPPPIMSELVFWLGFMKMPKLKQLTLGFHRLFMTGLGQEWQEQVAGRSVKVGKN